MQLHIEYNNNLVAKCLLAGIGFHKFIAEFITNLDEMDDNDLQLIKADFDRVAKENNL